MCASAEVRVKAVEVKVETAAEGLAETLIAMIEGRPVAGFGRSGRAGVPPPAADGDGTPSLPGNTIHPPVVIDYCIQHLGAVVNELDDAWRVGAHTSSDRFRGSLRSGDRAFRGFSLRETLGGRPQDVFARDLKS